MPKLKVFRTSVGFHDAYIAAPSQKAALEAWGSDKNLFAMGAAEVVTDPKLTKAPLASPGEVIRLTRGSLSEHLTAASRQSPPKKPRPAPEPEKPDPPKTRGAKPKPRPSRERLDQAEAAIASARSDAEAEIAELERREEALRREREMLEAQQRKALEKLEKQRDRVKEQYDRALDRWRASD